MSNILKNLVKTVGIISIVSITVISLLNFTNLFNSPITVNAAGTNTATLTIGQVDNGTTIDYSVCIQSTGTPIRLADVSHWIDTVDVSSTAGSNALNAGILKMGRFNSTVAQSNTSLQWYQVPPIVSASPAIWNMGVVSTAIPDIDGTYPLTIGNFINQTKPELLIKTRFIKTGANPKIDLPQF
jgi:hypothetical protein